MLLVLCEWTRAMPLVLRAMPLVLPLVLRAMAMPLMLIRALPLVLLRALPLVFRTMPLVLVQTMPLSFLVFLLLLLVLGSNLSSLVLPLVVGHEVKVTVCGELLLLKLRALPLPLGMARSLTLFPTAR